MTMTLAHPAVEDLGRFVDGTLDDAGRAAVVAHIADCDECRIVVVDTAEFVEPATASQWHWWVGIAAAAILLVGMGTLTNPEYRNKAIGWLLDKINVSNASLAEVKKPYGELKSRPIEASLSGFPYVGRRTMRGGPDESDPATTLLQVAAYDLLKRRGDDPRMQHAKGVARLLAAQMKLLEIPEGTTDEQKDLIEAEHRDVVVERDAAVALLQSAAIRVPDNASYQSDLAAALIATQKRENLNRAVKACDRALQLDRHSSEALFNRAVALQALSDQKKAIAAFKLYLTVDSSSPWSKEARTNIDALQESL